MNNSGLSFYTCLWLCCLHISACYSKSDHSEPQTQNTLLITGITIIDADKNSISPPKDILITGDKITSVTEPGKLSINDISKTVAGEGLYIMPGLIDVHAHIGNGGVAPQTPKDQEEALAQFIRYGVTTIFVPGGGGGNDHDLNLWKERCGQRASQGGQRQHRPNQ